MEMGLVSRRSRNASTDSTLPPFVSRKFLVQGRSRLWTPCMDRRQPRTLIIKGRCFCLLDRRRDWQLLRRGPIPSREGRPRLRTYRNASMWSTRTGADKPFPCPQKYTIYKPFPSHFVTNYINPNCSFVIYSYPCNQKCLRLPVQNFSFSAG